MWNVFQGDAGPNGPPGPIGDSGYGLPGPKVIPRPWNSLFANISLTLMRLSSVLCSHVFICWYNVLKHAALQMCPLTSTFHHSFLFSNEVLPGMYLVCCRVTAEIPGLQVHLVPKETAIRAPWWGTHSLPDTAICIISHPSSLFYPQFQPSIHHIYHQKLQ